MAGAGLIWAGLGQGIAQAGSTMGAYMAKGIEEENKKAFQKELLDLEEAKQVRLAKLQQDLAFEGKKREITELAPLQTAAEVERTGLIGKAQTSVEVDRATQLRPVQIESAKQVKQAELDVETGVTKERGKDKSYLGALSSLQNAKTSPLEKVQAALGQINLDNAKRVESLRSEFGKTDDADRKTAIREEIQILTGKDNDNFLPVPIKDEMGNVTSYQVFDKKAGVFVQPKAPTVEPPSAAVESLKKDPKLATQFDAKYGVGASKRYIGK